MNDYEFCYQCDHRAEPSGFCVVRKEFVPKKLSVVDNSNLAASCKEFLLKDKGKVKETKVMKIMDRLTHVYKDDSQTFACAKAGLSTLNNMQLDCLYAMVLTATKN